MLRRIRILVSGLVLLLAPAASADLTPGLYHSTDIGGKVLTPRATCSQDENLVPKPGVGDVMHLTSWDGGQLGTQWWISCATQPSPRTEKGGIDDQGNGTIIKISRFTGGAFYLSSGPWGEGMHKSLGTISEIQLTVVEEWQAFWLVKEQVTVEAYGRVGFTGNVVRFRTTVCSQWGESRGWMPPDYPALLDPDCASTRTWGYWWDLGGVTIEILKPSKEPIQAAKGTAEVTPPATSSWGRVKQIYR